MKEGALDDQTEHAEIEGCQDQLAQDWRSHGDDGLDRPKVVPDRVDEGQRPEEVSVTDSQDLGDSTTDVVPDQMARADVEAANELGGRFGLGGDGVVHVETEIGTTATLKVDGNHIEALGEPWNDAFPDEGVGRDPVDQEYGFTLARATVRRSAISDGTEAQIGHDTPLAECASLQSIAAEAFEQPG